MAYIGIIEPEEAEGIVKQEYNKGVRRTDRVSNILKVQSRSPETLQTSIRFYLAVMYGQSEALPGAAGDAGCGCLPDQSLLLLNRITR